MHMRMQVPVKRSASIKACACRIFCRAALAQLGEQPWQAGLPDL